MNITPNKLTVAQLFSNQNEQFIVPAYQRRYAWEKRQYAALFEDIKLLNENDGHLFGMLILCTSQYVGGLNKPEVVDGQQRITTLSLLLLALKRKYADLGNADKSSDIQKMLTSKGYDDIGHQKIVLGDLDNADFKQLLEYTYWDQLREGMSNLKLWDACYYFYSQLKSFNMEDLNRFFFKLTNVAVLIRLDVPNDRDAYKLFETINNRGLGLSPTDIIKNFLLGHASKINEYQQGALQRVKQLWSQIIINLNGLDTDDFLRQYMCSITGRKVSHSKLLSEFKSYYLNHVLRTDLIGEFAIDSHNISVHDEDSDEEQVVENNLTINRVDRGLTIDQFLAKIHSASKVYQMICHRTFETPSINRHLFNLQRILSTPSYIFLMDFFQKESRIDVQINVLKLIETFMLRRHVCESRTSEHDDIFAKMTRLNGENIIDEIKGYLLEKLPKDEAFKENFPNYRFNGKLVERARYILEQIEYYKTGLTSEVFLNFEVVQLEHIIPQNLGSINMLPTDITWESYLGDNAIAKHKNFLHLIGNMALISAPLNIVASNNPFKRKQPSYIQSNIQTTRELADYTDFRFEQVQQRGQQLADLALHIWVL